MNSKWMLFVALAVAILVVLYVASVGVGVQPQDRQVRIRLDAPWVQRLRARLTARLKPEDLRLVGGPASCQPDGAQVALPVGSACQFEIPPADRTRALRLKLVQGQAAALTLRQEGALDIENEPLAAGAAHVYDVYRSEEDAQLKLTACQVSEDGGRPLCRVSLE